MRTVRITIWFIFGFWLLWQVSATFNVAQNVSAFYPAPALTIAFIAIYGIRFIPIVFIGAMFSGFPHDVFWQLSPDYWWMSVRQALVYGLAGYSLRHIRKCNVPLLNSYDVFCFIGIAAWFSLVSAIVAVTIFWIYDFFPVDILPAILASFWAGDAAGIIMAFPLLYMLISELKNRNVDSVLRSLFNRGFAFYAQTILIPILFSAIGFGAAIIGDAGNHFGYLIALPVVWLASKNGIVGGAVSALSANMSAVLIYNLIGSSSYLATDLQILFAVTASIGLIVGSAFDERRALEQIRMKQEKQLAHITRISVIGELGASIAHEISTPLQAAVINAQLAIDQLAKKDPESFDKISQYNEQVMLAIDKASIIHNHYRDLLRGDTQEPAPTDLVDTIHSAVDLMKYDLSCSGISIELKFHNETPSVLASSVGLQQVLINLIKNAAASIVKQDRKEKRVTIELTKALPNNWRLSVDDTGTGLSDDNLESVFNSFYTTKGDGLGIGLSLSKNIIEGFGGSLSAENWERGARFIIELEPEHL